MKDSAGCYPRFPVVILWGSEDAGAFVFITEDDFITEGAFRKVGEVLTSKISQNLP